MMPNFACVENGEAQVPRPEVELLIDVFPVGTLYQWYVGFSIRAHHLSIRSKHHCRVIEFAFYGLLKKRCYDHGSGFPGYAA
jgi:hypothetical protein